MFWEWSLQGAAWWRRGLIFLFRKIGNPDDGVSFASWYSWIFAHGLYLEQKPWKMHLPKNQRRYFDIFFEIQIYLSFQGHGDTRIKHAWQHHRSNTGHTSRALRKKQAGCICLQSQRSRGGSLKESAISESAQASDDVVEIRAKNAGDKIKNWEKYAYGWYPELYEYLFYSFTFHHINLYYSSTSRLTSSNKLSRANRPSRHCRVVL